MDAVIGARSRVVHVFLGGGGIKIFSEITPILWKVDSWNSPPFVNTQHRRSHLLVLMLCLRRCSLRSQSRMMKINELHKSSESAVKSLDFQIVPA